MFRCRKLIIQVLVKFPFAQISRFKPKREKVAKGNLKAKTGKKPKREFNKHLYYKLAAATKKAFQKTALLQIQLALVLKACGSG